MEKVQINLKKATKSSLFAGVTIFIIIFVLNVILDQRFFSADTIYGNLSVITPIVVATIAQSIVIISGSIDLSIGANISLVNCILATAMGDTPESVVFALAVSLLAALAVSALNGVLVAYLRLPAMVATFAVSMMLIGIALLVLPVPGGYIPKWLPGIYSASIGGVLPATVPILAGIGVLWWVISKTRFGKYIYAVGGNENAAEASGINAKRIKFCAFLLSGFFIWIVGIIVSGQTGAGDFRVGNTYQLSTVAAAIMGGVALAGGTGKMLGAALGACIMILITNIIYFAGIPSFYQDMIRGLIVIIALFIAAIPNLKKRTS
ncbi:MAG: ABC transporter permease [Christensenella sp.]|uniref:ABC transporter permease n=1 Tax=Christensenella sp. TaxID=1935934 RepID=UPI002B2168FA|nr:ABC transporter permease [Christensenella sp.]MEA5004540.1 ABC transporter permease [Christensenella sp.]